MPLPQQMNAVTIDRFGGLDVLKFGRRQVPKVGSGQVLIRVSYAGVGQWDPLEREGGFVELTGEQPTFPVTLGSDGSGRIAAVGAGVEHLQEGDLVYAVGHDFYAEYVALDADAVSLVPDGLPRRSDRGPKREWARRVPFGYRAGARAAGGRRPSTLRHDARHPCSAQGQDGQTQCADRVGTVRGQDRACLSARGGEGGAAGTGEAPRR